MLILAVDTATKTAGVALLKDGKPIAELTLNVGLTHSVSLLPSVHNLLNLTDLTLEDIDALAYANGPGSFTGLRIGGAFIIGFAQSRGLPVYAIPTLEALALNGEGFDGIIAPMLDARKDEIYTAAYKIHAGNLNKVGEEKAIAPQEFCSSFPQPEKVLILGDAVEKYFDMFMSKGFKVSTELMRHTKAANIAYLAYQKYKNNEKALSYNEVKPYYLRVSEAEARLLEKSRCNDAK